MSLKRDWKFQKCDSLRFPQGACLIIEKRYSIATKNVSFNILQEILVSSDTWILMFVFWGPCYLFKIQIEWTYRKSHLQNNKLIKTLCIISWNTLDAFS